MEGGIDYLKSVIIHDSLGICADLERMMQNVVDTYRCEWAEVVNDPEKRRLFKQFINTGETEPTIEFVKERGQQHPGPWGASFISASELTVRTQGAVHEVSGLETRWIQVGKTWDFPGDGGAAIKYGKTQIAVFNFASRGEWYATQNMCPHRREFVLSRGLIGDQGDKPKVACPVHKKTFSLETGKGMSDRDFSIRTFPVKVEEDDVYLLLPSIDALDEELATDKTCNGSCHSGEPARPKKLPTRPSRVEEPLAVTALGDPA
jgi:nitrite reductase (NADH) large subunit